MPFFRSPVGRLASALLSICIAGLVYVFFIRDETEGAEKAAREDPTQVSADKDLYEGDNFAKALDKLRSKEGGNAKMLKVVVRPADAEFQVRKGERAAGYRYDAKSEDLEPVEVEPAGLGSLEFRQFSLEVRQFFLELRQFSLARVSPGITSKLIAALREENPALQATNMALERGLTHAPLAWTVNAEGPGRAGLVYMARPDGSGFADPVEFARRELRLPSSGSGSGGGTSTPPSVSDVQKQADCIKKAGSDVAEVQA